MTKNQLAVWKAHYDALTEKIEKYDARIDKYLELGNENKVKYYENQVGLLCAERTGLVLALNIFGYKFEYDSSIKDWVICEM